MTQAQSILHRTTVTRERWLVLRGGHYDEALCHHIGGDWYDEETGLLMDGACPWGDEITDDGRFRQDVEIDVVVLDVAGVVVTLATDAHTGAHMTLTPAEWARVVAEVPGRAA